VWGCLGASLCHLDGRKCRFGWQRRRGGLHSCAAQCSPGSPTCTFIHPTSVVVFSHQWQNRGLGHYFLRHIERTKAIAYVLDCQAGTGGERC
jgi:hypothetical protein